MYICGVERVDPVRLWQTNVFDFRVELGDEW